MDDFRYCPREFMSLFIETYKANPCLWRVDTQEYRDKKKRQAGYEALMKLMQTFSPSEEVTIEDVKKRINTIRTCYNREVRKLKDSKPTKPYTPTLWYFDDMSFLEDGTPTTSTTVIQSDNGGTDDGVDFHKIYVAAQNDSEDSQPSSPTGQEQTTRKRHLHKNSRDSLPKKKIIKQKSLKDVHADYDDEYDIMGKGFANKLRRISKLSRERVGVAEKLINDVLFQAEFVDISMDARVVNAPNPPKEEW